MTKYVDMRAWALKHWPAIKEAIYDLSWGEGDKKILSALTLINNRCVTILDRHNTEPSKGDSVRDVGFRYGVDSCRIESEMEEAK